MRLKVWSYLVEGIEPIPFGDGQLIEASSLDRDEGFVNHLIHRIWRQGNDGDDVAFLKAVKKFFDQVSWVPSSTPVALVLLLLSCVGGAVVGAQVVDDGTGTVGGPV